MRVPFVCCLNGSNNVSFYRSQGVSRSSSSSGKECTSDGPWVNLGPTFARWTAAVSAGVFRSLIIWGDLASLDQGSLAEVTVPWKS